MTDWNLSRMKTLIENFKGKRIIVLGDLMLDKYIWGDVVRISPEAPVPVVEVKKDSICLGGAGNVYHNLETLGASPVLVGIVGKDPEGKWITNNISDARGIIIDEQRPTTVKTRIIAHHQQVVRVDIEKKHPISQNIENQLFDFIKGEKCAGILLSDYNKGILSPSLMRKVLSFAKDNEIPVFVDPKVENLFLFSPVTLITPNHSEAEKIVHYECLSNKQVEKAGEEILSRISAKYLILKRGENGMSVFEKGQKPFHIPANAKEVYDVTGAGDTVIATVALALLSGATIREAAFLANAAAGVVVGKIGTVAIHADELLEALRPV
ncbi:MAG: D-glycero-beta-D-manno-heptose-7-phosphate kinase [Candidatus Aminicenantes bacterium]|nr:D-glycero-beta-D-manno-heptose-7-phosphate kinase [Candidatus Aminicenantes bacterium]